LDFHKNSFNSKVLQSKESVSSDAIDISEYFIPFHPLVTWWLLL
jgi:hypothetical protein